MLAAALVSGVMRHWGWEKGLPKWDFEKDRVRTVIGIGDVLAVLAIVIAAIGLVRAFVAPLVLALSPSELSGGLSAVAWPLGCVVLGFVVAVSAWPIAAAVLRRLHNLTHQTRPMRSVEVITPGLPAAKDMTPARAHRRTPIRIVLVVAALVLLAMLGSVPYQTATWTGVIACMVLAVTGLVTVLGVVVVISQEHPPLQLFRVMGLRTTPVVTLIFVAAALTWLQSGDAGLHGIQEIDKANDAAHRPTLDAAFAQWMATSGACNSYVPVQTTPTSRRQVRLRPMVLVAAEGGGIRAAYWTASALEKMTHGGTGNACPQQAVFLSSGISGGSLGLAIAATNAGPSEAAGRVSAPDALGAAALGLLVRYDFAAVTGFHLPTLDRAGAPGWQDRAALMESIWQRQASGLQDPFLGGGPTATGQLILNSTSVGTGCRVLVSQIRLDNPTNPAASKQDPSCRIGAAVAPSTFDLFTNYAYRTSASSDDRCLHWLRMVTAAMLSARFAYVTPSGVVGPCNHFTSQQLDGGYAEGTGLGTLIDLAPRWLGLVRGTNAAALAALQAPQATPPVFVAPIVVLLKNSSGSDITPSTSKLTTEIQVPLRGREAKAAQTDTNTLLQRATQLTDPAGLCPVTASDLCTQLTSATRTRIPRPVILAAPDTTPSITAPLGWVLSQASRTTLGTALNNQSKKPCSALPQTAACVAGYGRLADLLTELYEPEPAWLWRADR